MGRTPGSRNKPKGNTVQAQTAERIDTVADQPTSKGEVAIFQPARLPYHPAIEERFGLDKGTWKVLVEAIFPAAKSVDAIVMALSYCKSRGLDIMKRPVHVVPMWDSARGAMVETIWPSISELRTTASRTKGYAGCDEAEFGAMETKKFEGRAKQWENGRSDWKDIEATVTFPKWCRITVYRVVDGQRCKFVGPKVVWEESYATIGNSAVPNTMWQERPEGQLEKCAEAAALRRAFPEEIGNELTAEERIGRNVHDLSVDIPAVTDAATTANKDAGPPRAITATKPAEPPIDDQARDGTPPPREPKPEPKADPISSGPPRTTAPKAAPAPNDEGPSDPGPQPHKIPGTGETYETWSAKFMDLIQTSPDMATLYKWSDLNADPLARLAKGKPSVNAQVSDMLKRVMEKLKDEKKKVDAKAAKKAAPADMDAPGDMDGEAEISLNEGPADMNPETILKWAKDALDTVTDANQLDAFYNDTIQPHTDGLFPPDQDQIAGYYRAAEKRLGID